MVYLDCNRVWRWCSPVKDCLWTSVYETKGTSFCLVFGPTTREPCQRKMIDCFPFVRTQQPREQESRRGFSNTNDAWKKKPKIARFANSCETSNREESDVRKSYDNASKEESNNDDRYYPWKRDSRQIRWVATRHDAKRREGVRLQARKNARKLLKTVSNRGHSAVYASFFRRCNFLFASRTPTLLLSIKGEEPSGHYTVPRPCLTGRLENYFFFACVKAL